MIKKAAKLFVGVNVILYGIFKLKLDEKAIAKLEPSYRNLVDSLKQPAK